MLNQETSCVNSNATTIAPARYARLLAACRGKAERDFHARKIFDYSPEELEKAAQSKLEGILKRREESGQMFLNFDPSRDHSRLGFETKRLSCIASREMRIGRRAAIIELLRANPQGLTRHQIAEASGLADSDVSSPVRTLIKLGLAHEPRKVEGHRGFLVAVVCLTGEGRA